MILSSLDQVGGAKQKRLEKALEKALGWQSSVDDTKETINGHDYFGPHKWIVCLIGADTYTVQDFMLKHKGAIEKKSNLSISIMGLSGEALELHTQDYKKLTNLTKEGEFLNIVEKATADHYAKQFFGAMNVYPSKEIPVVRERFHNI